jgi:hypothetical protein
MALTVENTAAAPAGAVPDTSLPDPSIRALKILGASLFLAAFIAIVMNATSLTGKTIDPPAASNFQFTIFAAFYAAAQIIERLMEFISPFLKGDLAGPNGPLTGAAAVAQTKADRAKQALGIASVAGVLAANAFGLYLLSLVGIQTSNTIDAFATGLVIAAGTKPLHDFISLLGSQGAPKTVTDV